MFRLRREAAIFVERDVTDKDRRHATNAGVVYNRVYAGNEQTVGPVAADLARIMHEEWNADRIVDGAMHDCDECQNLPRVYD